MPQAHSNIQLSRCATDPGHSHTDPGHSYTNVHLPIPFMIYAIRDAVTIYQSCPCANALHTIQVSHRCENIRINIKRTQRLRHFSNKMSSISSELDNKKVADKPSVLCSHNAFIIFQNSIYFIMQLKYFSCYGCYYSIR